MVKVKRAIFLSANTGNGHKSVMYAINSYLQQDNINTLLFPHFYEDLSDANDKMSQFYNMLQMSSSKLCRIYTQMSLLETKVKNNENYKVYWYDALSSFFQNNNISDSDTIISTAPIINYYLFKFINENGILCPKYIVVTDPYDPIYPGFCVEGADKYFVPNIIVASILRRSQIEDNKIIISGYPLHYKFDHAKMKNSYAIYEKYKLDKNKKTILINCGAQGTTHFSSIITAVHVTYAGQYNIVVICGKNKLLYEQITLLFADIVTFGFIDYMEEILLISDLCITKAGANSLYECLYMNTPVLIDATDGLLYQESGIQDFLLSSGVGILFFDIESLLRALKSYHDNSFSPTSNWKEAIKCLSINNGSHIISKYIIEEMKR